MIFWTSHAPCRHQERRFYSDQATSDIATTCSDPGRHGDPQSRITTTDDHMLLLLRDCALP